MHGQQNIKISSVSVPYDNWYLFCWSDFWICGYYQQVGV